MKQTKKHWALWTILFLFGAFVLVSCNKDDDDDVDPMPPAGQETVEAIVAETPLDPYTIAKKLVDQAGWPEEVTLELQEGSIDLLNYQRSVITGDIVHYSFEVALSSNQYDRITIHRVVKETGGEPLLTEKTLFFQHGDAKNFVGMMMPSQFSPSMPDDFGMAIYLAQNGVDVWGVDQAWCTLPADATDFSLFENFGMEKASRDMRTAMAVARVARFLTGNELEKINLAGYSSAVVTGFTALNTETQLTDAQRHIKGWIPIDLALKTDEQILEDAWGGQVAVHQQPYDMGVYESYVGFTAIAGLAIDDPSDDSPIVQGFTNMEAAQFFVGGNLLGTIPFHYWATNYENDFPSANLKYTTWEQAMDFMLSAIEWQPHLFILEFSQVMADQEDVPYDDYLDQIDVPILNIAAGGGFGESSKYGVSLTASSDIEHIIPILEDPSNILEDFGHIDIFTGNNTQTLVWEGLLDWLQTH